MARNLVLTNHWVVFETSIRSYWYWKGSYIDVSKAIERNWESLIYGIRSLSNGFVISIQHLSRFFFKFNLVTLLRRFHWNREFLTFLQIAIFCWPCAIWIYVLKNGGDRARLGKKNDLLLLWTAQLS